MFKSLSDFERSVGAAGLVIVVGVIVFVIYRDTRRRKTLHRRNDGTFVWTDWDGKERSARDDPSAKGGDWDNGSDGGGDGGGE